MNELSLFKYLENYNKTSNEKISFNSLAYENSDLQTDETKKYFTWLKSDLKGFTNRENQANAYFKPEYLYEDIVVLYKLHFPNTNECYMVSEQGKCLLDNHDIYGTIKDNVYETLEEAEQAFSKISHSGLPSVKTVIENAKRELGKDFEIFAIKELNLDGYYISYEVYYKGEFFNDTIFDFDESTFEKIREFAKKNRRRK